MAEDSRNTSRQNKDEEETMTPQKAQDIKDAIEKAFAAPPETVFNHTFNTAAEAFPGVPQGEPMRQVLFHHYAMALSVRVPMVDPTGATWLTSRSNNNDRGEESTVDSREKGATKIGIVELRTPWGFWLNPSECCDQPVPASDSPATVKQLALMFQLALKSQKLVKIGFIHCASVNDGAHRAWLKDPEKLNVILQASVMKGWPQVLTWKYLSRLESLLGA